MLENLRYAVRQLFRAPTFTIVTILTLALGVGANTAIFSVIQAVLLHPSGVQDPERVASFHAKYTQLNLPSIGVSAPDFQDAQSMHEVGGYGCDGAGGELQCDVRWADAASARGEGEPAVVPGVWGGADSWPDVFAGGRPEGRRARDCVELCGVAEDVRRAA